MSEATTTTKDTATPQRKWYHVIRHTMQQDARTGAIIPVMAGAEIEADRMIIREGGTLIILRDEEPILALGAGMWYVCELLPDGPTAKRKNDEIVVASPGDIPPHPSQH